MVELLGGIYSYIHIHNKMHYIDYDKSLKLTYPVVVVYFTFLILPLKNKINLNESRSFTQKDYQGLQINQTL